MTQTRTFAKAAAGTGKTVRLVQEYLACLAAGIPVDQVVAITFTRKAAAELIERASQVLYVLSGIDGPQVEKARTDLGDDFKSLYEPHAPKDRGKVLQALAGISAAPVGTIDSFVQRLLGEFALDAAFPLPEGEEAVPLDLPIAAGGSTAEAFEETVRELLSPTGGHLDLRVVDLLVEFDLKELVEILRTPLPFGAERVALHKELLPLIASEYGRYLQRGLGSGTKLADWIRDPEGLNGDPPDDDAVSQEDGRWTKPGRPTLTAVRAWLRAGGIPEEAPLELAAFLADLCKQNKTNTHRSDALEDVLGKAGPAVLTVGVGAGAVRLTHERIAKLAPAWLMGPEAANNRERCDAVRKMLFELRRDITRRALRRSAEDGSLGYDELLQSATQLCRTRPEALVGRFKALLVDEVQDSSPEQVEFYLALAATNPGMRCFFVGDSRQSIYGFRKADPAGLVKLSEGCSEETLARNYRSTPALVRAHKALFGEQLRNMFAAEALEPLESLASLEPGRKEGGSDEEHPVLLIRDCTPAEVESAPEKITPAQADERALEEFAERVSKAWAAWEEAGSKGKAPTAAVLAPVWRVAAWAREVLKIRLVKENGPACPTAYLDGGGRWLDGQTVEDMRMLLRALLDRSDAIAWLAVWKHPMVGLSDRALARVRIGEGLVGPDGRPADPWCKDLGWLLEATALESPHDQADIVAFARAREPLRSAVDDLASQGTAATLEALASRLGWRELLAVSPDDDAGAKFEMLLEWFRTMDQDGMQPADVLSALKASDETTDAPRLELKRPAKHVACTTVFQAKGLQWDHVCVLRCGIGPEGGGTEEGMTVTLGGTSYRLDPLKIASDGAFAKDKDVLSGLLSSLHAVRKKEELLRLTYVAITRAKKSVTFALPNAGFRGMQKTLAAAWSGPMDGVQMKQWEKATTIPSPSRGYVTAVGEVVIPAVTPKLWLEVSPSQLHGSLGGDDAASFEEKVKERVRSNGVFQKSLYESTRLPQLGRKDGRPATDLWGSVVHGWLERWRFNGTPEPDAIREYLVERWTTDDDTAVEFLVSVCDKLSSHPDSPAWKLVTEAGAELHFEMPILGPGDELRRDGRTVRHLAQGRADLLVRRATGNWVVLDFKTARARFESKDALLESRQLKVHGKQLEAYRSVLTAALQGTSDRVEQVGLWFVRTGAVVMW